MPVCPPSINKPNKTICNKEYVCYMGECTGSICLAYGLESCQCAVGPTDPAIKACELCCKQPGEDRPCLSSFDWNEPPFDVPDMYAKPGTPCNDYNGYCDVAQKCREVDPSGPLATLRKLLLSEESIASFKRWILSNWYTVALIVTAVLVLLVSGRLLLLHAFLPMIITFFLWATTHQCKPGEQKIRHNVRHWKDIPLDIEQYCERISFEWVQTIVGALEILLLVVMLSVSLTRRCFRSTTFAIARCK